MVRAHHFDATRPRSPPLQRKFNYTVSRIGYNRDQHPPQGSQPSFLLFVRFRFGLIHSRLQHPHLSVRFQSVIQHCAGSLKEMLYRLRVHPNNLEKGYR
jgi:hypothetical protein